MITTSKNRNFNLFLLTACGAALLITFVIASSAIVPSGGAVNNQPNLADDTSNVVRMDFSASAFPQYRYSEWASVKIPAIAADMTAYHLSERTLVDAKTGLEIYLLSERTLIDPQTGMAVYLQSERTSIPVRFTPHQRSEWFGE